jgi:hypothetical protein
MQSITIIILTFSRHATIFSMQTENGFPLFNSENKEKAQPSFQINLILNRSTGFMYRLDFHSLNARNIPKWENVHIIYMGL